MKDPMLTQRPTWMPPEKKYRVRQLDWKGGIETESGSQVWTAETKLGRFAYGRDTSGLFYFQTPTATADRQTLAAAKEAAQQAYAVLVKGFHLEEIK